MNCQDIARILDERDVDDLLAREQSDVQAHLATCRDCARDWQIQAQLADARIPAVPPELRALYSPRVEGVVGLAARRRSRFIIVGSLAAAAAAAMLALQMNTVPAPVAAMVDATRVEPSRQGFGKVLPSPTAPTPEEESKSVQALEEWTQRLTEWLTARDDPDSLIAAALLLEAQPGDAAEIPLLLQRATALAPANERIQAVAMHLCLKSTRCDPAPYEQALRRIAPDNALGWVEEVNRSLRGDDTEALQRALAAMSRARTLDLHAGASILSLISQLRSALVAPPDIEGYHPSMVSALAFDAAGSLTASFEMLRKPCKSATDARTLLECRQIGAAMRAGDSFMANWYGIEISGYGLPADSAEARSLVRQMHQLRWLNQQMAGIFPDDGVSADQREDFLRVMVNRPREADVLRALLEERGIPTEPPADWKP